MKINTPHTTYFSKNSSIKGWKIFEQSNSYIIGTSKDSPDFAKDYMLYQAESLGANAVLNARYFKTTGSSGNYKYTIHNYMGNPAVIGNENPKGIEFEEGSLERVIEFAYNSGKKSIKRNWIFRVLILIPLFTFLYFKYPNNLVGVLFFGFIGTIIVFKMLKTNHNDWILKD